MKMTNNHTFYFGKVPPEHLEIHNESSPKGWEPGWYYRLRIVDDDQEIKIEDSCGRMVPIPWNQLFTLEKAFIAVVDELAARTFGKDTDV